MSLSDKKSKYFFLSCFDNSEKISVFTLFNGLRGIIYIELNCNYILFIAYIVVK